MSEQEIIELKEHYIALKLEEERKRKEFEEYVQELKNLKVG